MNAEPAPIFETWGDVVFLALIGVYVECIAATAFYMLRWLLTR